LDQAAYQRFLEREQHRDGARQGAPEDPEQRMLGIARRLLDAPDGIDVFDEAGELFVSDSTIEADLSRVRRLITGTGLTLRRRGTIVALEGSELERRKMLSRLFRDQVDSELVTLAEVERAFGMQDLASFKAKLSTELDARGYFVNEYGMADVMLHIAIALDRVGRNQRIPELPEPADDAIARTVVTLDRLISTTFGVTLDRAELQYLATLLSTRVLAPGNTADGQDLGRYVDPDVAATVRRIVDEASTRYFVDLRDEPFIVRLALHVQNLLARASTRQSSRNPLTRSIKTSYPLIYELAVYIASRLQQAAGIVVTDDEIAYIAMHVGAYLEQQQRRRHAVRVALVCPGYYDMHRLLRDRIEAELGDDLEVTTVVSDADPDWGALRAELVVTTIAPPTPRENVLVIQPFLTEHDVVAVRQAVARVRRQRRRTRIKRRLLRYFDESRFFRNAHAADEVGMIRLLAAPLQEAGVIDERYVTDAIDRERMSSTAFTDMLAVPHGMSMTARETAISIAVNEQAMDWGESRVNVVAFIAFTAGERSTFQEIFDQFVEVFGDREAVQALVRKARDFPSFIDELVHLFDS
jgi:lichenan operon transcriptional antiterminator